MPETDGFNPPPLPAITDYGDAQQIAAYNAAVEAYGAEVDRYNEQVERYNARLPRLRYLPEPRPDAEPLAGA